MSNTPVITSGDVNVKVASHLSKVPLIATDASTSNLTELSTGVILNTGTPPASWARLVDASKTKARIQKMVNRMAVVRPPIGLQYIGPLSHRSVAERRNR